jgi:ubiquinone/menaquinone biosynthesis C-methylase UbiE
MKITKLDLGGTMDYVSKTAVMVDREFYQDWAGDEVSYKVIADYDRLPFAANAFKEAAGSCVLEGEERQTWFNEFARVLRPGGRLQIKGCGSFDSIPFSHILLPEQAGFKLREMAGFYNADAPSGLDIDSPYLWIKS